MDASSQPYMRTVGGAIPAATASRIASSTALFHPAPWHPSRTSRQALEPQVPFRAPTVIMFVASYSYVPYSYASMGGQAQTMCLSPYALSIRATGGQYLLSRVHGTGNAALSREYGWLQSSRNRLCAVCGAFFRTLSEPSACPISISKTSRRIAIIASQK